MGPEDTPYLWDIRRPIVAGKFDFPGGHWTYRSQGTANWLAKICLGGSGTILAGDERFRSGRGDVFLFEPGTPHDFGATRHEEWNTVWVHFHMRPDWAPYTEWTRLSRGIRVRRTEGSLLENDLEQTALRVVRWAESALAHRDLLAQAALSELLIIADAAAPSGPMPAYDARVMRVLQYIAEHIGDSLSVEHLAGVAAMSASGIAHLFRQELGKTLQEYVEFRRIELAKVRLLATTETVAAIAQSLGYQSQFYFSRRFKGSVGVSPTEFRAGSRRPD